MIEITIGKPQTYHGVSGIITEDNFCLRNGKWCSFNIAYLDCIFQKAKKVAFINHSQDEFALSKDDVIQFAKENDFMTKQAASNHMKPSTIRTFHS